MATISVSVAAFAGEAATGGTNATGKVMPTKQKDVDEAFTWLQERCRKLVAAARYTTADGMVYYYPVANGQAYPWFYLRDYAYMYQSAPEFFPKDETRRLLVLLLTKIRQDGWAPERIAKDGTPIYRCHGKGDVLDSGPYFVQLFRAYAGVTGDDELVKSNLDKFWKMLEVLPHEKETGLIWIPPDNPHTGYGFTDQIAKTGRELFCTLLVYESLTILQQWATDYQRPDLSAKCEDWRALIRKNLALLWAEKEGLFYAASQDCRQLDIWGSIYACRLGIPSPEHVAKMHHWFASNRDTFEYRAHLRLLPEPELWQRIIPGLNLPPGEFQNGPYWSTPSGWYAEVLESKTPGAGIRFLCELVTTFRDVGVWECIRRDDYRRIAGNLSSALLPYGSFKRLRAGGNNASVGLGKTLMGDELLTTGTQKGNVPAKPTAAVGKILFLGNSITLHPPKADIGWTNNCGMAASALEKDYVHLLLQRFTAAAGGKAPEARILNIADFEREYATYPIASKFQTLAEFKADTVILCIGENVPGLASKQDQDRFKEAVAALLTLVKGAGSPALFVRSSFWPDGAKDAILKQVCTEAGGTFVDISRLSSDPKNYARSERKFSHDGVARHPSDAGMAAIAEAIWNAMPGPVPR